MRNLKWAHLIRRIAPAAWADGFRTVTALFEIPNINLQIKYNGANEGSSVQAKNACDERF